MTDGPTIDLDQTRRFLHALTGEESPAVCWQTFADPAELKEEKSLAVTKTLRLAAIEQWLVQVNAKRAGIFVTVNATDGHGRKVENVTGLRALFVDCDGTRELPTEWPLAPSIVVQRDATHWHAYWLLVAGQPRERFTAAQVQLAVHWQTDVSIKDLPRVMRVPGFIHHKGSPTAVALRCAHGQLRYSIDQVMAAHPVDWAALCHSREAIAAALEAERPTLERAAAYWRAAEREGLCGAAVTTPAAASSSAPRPAPPANLSPRPQASGVDLADDDWHVEMYRKWALTIDMAPGAANARGGQDNAAFTIACEGYARSDQVGGRFSYGVVEREVADYLGRVGWSNIDAECARICSSARRRENKRCTLPTRPQRRAHGGAVARAPAERADVGDVFADPPADPPASAAGATGEEGGPKPWDGLDTVRLQTTWVIGDKGVAPVQWDSKAQGWQVKVNNRVSDRPIWPVREGRDLASGALWWEIAWNTREGVRETAWLTEEAMKRGHELVALRSAPITQQQCERCATWLTAAAGAVTNPTIDVTSRVGWVGHNGSRRWVWPEVGAEGARYVGEDLGEVGELAGWRVGVDTLLGLPGDKGYTGLVVLGYSLGSPFARLAGGGRRPVVGLMAQSSTGKGSVLNYAVSAWCEPRVLSQMASSSIKGIQDRGVQFPDCPIVVDDLQQLHQYDPRQAHEVVYFLGNGQRRTTSSKAQKAVGGELRYGVGFYAAESPILQGANLGANLRVIELTTDPCPDEATAKALNRATVHAGAMAGPMARHLATHTAAQWADRIAGHTSAYRATIVGLRGSDAECLAILRVGLEALAACLDIEAFGDQVEEIVAWLAARIATQRETTVDRETQCLAALLDQVLNGHWKEDNSQDGREGQLVAWRKVDDRGTEEIEIDGEMRRIKKIEITEVEVNTAADGPARVLRDFGGETRVLTAWLRRGWLKADGRHLKVKKQWRGQPIGRVLRLTETALAQYRGVIPEPGG
jgi:hypothetical protein